MRKLVRCRRATVREEQRYHVAAMRIEITGRLNWPQPGESDGGVIYSNLDVCLAQCA